MNILEIKACVDNIISMYYELNSIECEIASMGETSYKIFNLDRRQKEIFVQIKVELTRINKLSKIALLQIDYQSKGV